MEVNVAEALRTVAERLSRKPWSVGVEEAFRELAAELEFRAKNLDPLPYIHLTIDRRVPVGSRAFYPAEVLRFAPREDYVQDESEYPKHV